MAFNIALSGLKASQIDLETTGNNIANASTVGFKKSRAEFGDLYSNSFLSAGQAQVGDGVRVQEIRQQFSQGNITNTDSGLDLAINGEGFFVLNNNGEVRYTRAGQFGVDRDGFIVNNQGMRVQGFSADEDGNLSGVRGDLEVQTDNLAPRRTTLVESDVNLDAREDVLAERFQTFTAEGSGIGQAINTFSGTAELPAETWQITNPDGTVSSLTTAAGSAGAVAATLSQQDGISADASTTALLSDGDFNPDTGTNSDALTINGVSFTLDSGAGAPGLQALADDINNSALVGVSAAYQGGQLAITSNRGDNLDFTFSTSGSGLVRIAGPDSDGVSGSSISGPIELDGSSGKTNAAVVGTIDFTLNDGYNIEPDPTSGSTAIVNNPTYNQDVTNLFDPDDQRTYNHATSTTMYDSLGNPHVMTQYFVKEPSAAPNPSNLWTMYVQIDGENVGPPSAVDGSPTLASFNLRFNNDGSLDETLSDDVLISNWTPLDANGNPNGADGPNPSGSLPIPQPPESSNFEVDMGSATQFGSNFAVNNLSQNGYTTGRLTGLDVSSEGLIFARFSNGQSSVLGQVSLANFQNPEGLAPVGETTWVETVESGDAVVGAPDSGPLGSIKSSSVEESNVDLSDQLVNLIVAQRNYQANAKTIETSDAITQTIINLR
ncbi:flagellar hook protein FlgE [Marinobacteraceae bacterium S3BR75-40.1]